MDTLRKIIDGSYDYVKSSVYHLTSKDPEIAHEGFVVASQIMHALRLENIIFDCSENKMHPLFEISNAAGFDKNGNIPPTFMRYLGFDRVVVGTVTYEPWTGNPRPRIKRYPQTESIVNWQGLPGIGAERVAHNLLGYGNHEIPLTINLMATPRPGVNAVEDVLNTIRLTRDIPYVDRYELNISCPNTHSSSGGIDARTEYLSKLEILIDAMTTHIYQNQSLYIKVSPDLGIESIKRIVRIVAAHKVDGIVTANTTTNHDPMYITTKPNLQGRGGASGKAVYSASTSVQEAFMDERYQAGANFNIIACGGIDSQERAKERTKEKYVYGIQIYTPLIFKGPRLLRELRRS
jgi:dihydroorotate dehydrogenase